MLPTKFRSKQKKITGNFNYIPNETKKFNKMKKYFK